MLRPVSRRRRRSPRGLSVRRRWGRRRRGRACRRRLRRLRQLPACSPLVAWGRLHRGAQELASPGRRFRLRRSSLAGRNRGLPSVPRRRWLSPRSSGRLRTPRPRSRSCSSRTRNPRPLSRSCSRRPRSRRGRRLRRRSLASRRRRPRNSRERWRSRGSRIRRQCSLRTWRRMRACRRSQLSGKECSIIAAPVIRATSARGRSIWIWPTPRPGGLRNRERIFRPPWVPAGRARTRACPVSRPSTMWLVRARCRCLPTMMIPTTARICRRGAPAGSIRAIPAVVADFGGIRQGPGIRGQESLSGSRPFFLPDDNRSMKRGRPLPASPVTTRTQR